MKATEYDRAFLFKRWAGQCVIIINEVDFKADATAATHEQMFKIMYSENNRRLKLEGPEMYSSHTVSYTHLTLPTILIV